MTDLENTMTIERARELLQIQVDLGGGYNRNSVRLILFEISKEHGQEVADKLIDEFALDQIFGLQKGIEIKPW